MTADFSRRYDEATNDNQERNDIRKGKVGAAQTEEKPGPKTVQNQLNRPKSECRVCRIPPAPDEPAGECYANIQERPHRREEPIGRRPWGLMKIHIPRTWAELG